MLTRNSLIAHVRALLAFEPSTYWKDRTKIKLMTEFTRCNAQPLASRQWALYATYDPEPVRFAEAVRELGSEWRPVAICPERLAVAVSVIEPALVAIDGRVPHSQDLAEVARSSSVAPVAVVASDIDGHSSSTCSDLTGFTPDQLARFLALGTMYRLGYFSEADPD